jgi:hypothetical protein
MSIAIVRGSMRAGMWTVNPHPGTGRIRRQFILVTETFVALQSLRGQLALGRRAILPANG